MRRSIARILAGSAVFAVGLLGGCTGQPAAEPAPAQPPTLAELCKEHRSDKCASRHNYVEIYELFFGPLRERPLRFLEIGVFRGESMRLWQAYFESAEIFGIDIEDTSEHETARIRTFVADQADRQQLAAVIEEAGSDFDIILDDGGHSMEQQQVSFGFLFPHVRPGGLYIIEDVHTSFRDLYPYRQYGVALDESNTTWAMIRKFVRTQTFESPYVSAEEAAYLTEHVEDCLYWNRVNEFHSDLFLCRKKS